MNMSSKDNLMKKNDLSPGGLDTWSGVGEMGGGGGRSCPQAPMQIPCA